MLNKKDERVAAVICILLDKIGMSKKISGYKFLCTLLELRYLYPEFKKHLYNALFDEVAQQYDTRAINIERNIRHALEMTWNSGNAKVLYDLYGDVVAEDTGKPTIAKFVDHSMILISEQLAKGEINQLHGEKD